MTDLQTPISRQPAIRVGAASLRWRTRSVVVVVVLAVAAFVLTCLSVSTGEFEISLSHVLAVLFGGGDYLDRLFIIDERLPRAVTGLLVGAALGLSGAIVQTIARNPLASPDILGVNAGAALAAVAAIGGYLGPAASLSGGASLTVPALVGGLLAGVTVYVLAWRRGVDGFRLVLIGVAVTALLQAVTQWVIATIDVRLVGGAQSWLVGSLRETSWSKLAPTAIGLVVMIVVVAILARNLGPLSLGPDIATGLGVRGAVARSALLIAAVLLVGISTAAAGPIVFVAFLAPQVALRLVRMPTPPLTASALTGAVLLTESDWLARVIIPFDLPVGIITSMIGCPFLIYLLAQRNRKVTL